jgi:plastocyanin
MQGDTVRWTNNSSVLHKVSADDGSFYSNDITSGQSYQWTFNTPGTYRYYCGYHGGPGGYGMSGTITVSAPQSQVQQNVSLTQSTATTQTTQTTSTGNPTVDALRAQVTELLNRIDVLRQQYGGAPATGVTSGATAGAVQCPHISRSLKKGSTGDDVSRLQRFLALDPAVYPEAMVTGYYGALTEAAVKRFQCKNQIVCEGTPESTGYGVTGPRTAAILALQCPAMTAGGGDVGGFLKVTPLSGPAPLAVTIETTVNATKACSAATYEVDYGDGTQKTQIVVPANYCNELRQVLNHSYTRAGTFTVTLRSGIHQVTSTVTVSGGVSVPPPASSIDTFSASPRDGSAPLTVTFKGIINAARKCDQQYTLSFGDGASTPLTPSGCTANSITVTHVYVTAGTFVARLTRDTGNVEVGSVSITTAGGQSVDTLAANPTTGEAPLGVSFTGIVNGATACNATYTIDFGDNTNAPIPVSGCTATSYSVAHTYGSAGTFTVRLKQGGADVKTATITVTGPAGPAYDGYFSVSPGTDTYTVTAEFELESSCARYELDWGDGTAKLTQPQGTCTIGTVSKTFNHTYDNAGGYTITLRRGSSLDTTHTAGIAITD